MGRFILGAVAAINIVAAVFFIGCGVCANVLDAGKTWHVDVNNQRVADEKMLNTHLEKQVPGYPAVKIAGIVLGYGACIGLILSSIALFFGRWWSKLIAPPIYALCFLHHVAFIVYTLVWVHPAIEGFFNQVPRPGIFGDAADFMIKGKSFSERLPGYISIAWWIAG